MFQEMKIGMRLWVGFGLILLLLVLVAGTGIYCLDLVQGDLDVVIKDRYPKTVLANEIGDGIDLIAQESKNILFIRDPAQINEVINNILASRHLLDEKRSALEKITRSTQGKEIVSNVRDSHTAYISAHDRFLELVKNNRFDEGSQLLLQEVQPLQNVYQKNVQALIAFENDKMALAGMDATTTQHRGVLWVLAMLGMALMLSVGLAWRIGNSVTLPLGKAVNLIRRIGCGDIPEPIQEPWAGEFEHIRESLNTAGTAIRTLIQDVRMLGQAGVEGRLTARADIMRHGGDYRNIIEMINATLDAVTHPVLDIIHVMTSLEKGDLTQRVTAPSAGMMGQLRHAVNNTVDQIREMIEDIQFIALSAGQGDFSVRLEARDKQGYHQTLSELLNQLSNVTEDGLLNISRVAEALARGDLTETIDREYPGLFGQVQMGINATVENLKTLVKGIKESADSINTSAGELAIGNSDLSQRTAEQAAALEETAASVEELTSTVQQNAENARQANQLSLTSSSVAEKGGVVVNEVVNTMEAINDSAYRIVDIISVIDGIAFQTNILALNAAVEAARAGEQGRGFSVVAAEVRTLAQRSATAAKEIQALINDSVSNVKAGTQLVGEAGQTMGGIITSINRVTGIMQEISAAASEQSKGIEQVNQAIIQIEDVTHRNAALVEEAAAATESLKEQANILATSVAEFRLQAEGKSVTKTRSLPPAAAKTETSHFDDAIAAHIKWKIRLNKFIDGTSTEKLDAETICKDNLCVLGKWIYGDGKKHQDIPCYADLVTKHAHFHRCAGGIVKKVEAHDQAGAMSLLKGEFSSAAKETVTTLMSLKRNITMVK